MNTKHSFSSTTIFFSTLFALLFAANSAQANTWKIIRDANKTSGNYYCTITECDDDGNAIAGGWILRAKVVNASSGNAVLSSVSQTSSVSTTIDLSLPKAEGSSIDKITGSYKNVFTDNKTLTEVVLSSPSYKFYDGYNFSGCSALTKVTIPGSIVCASSKDFQSCTALKELVFKKGPGSFVGSTFTGIPSGQLRWYVEDPTEWTNGWTDANCTAFDKATTGALSLDSYKDKFPDGTEPDFIRNKVGTTTGHLAQWLTIKSDKAAAAKLLAIAARKTDDDAEIEFGTPSPTYSSAIDRATGALPLICTIADETVTTNGVKYAPYAYQVSAYIDNVWVHSDPVESLSYSFNPDDNNVRRLVWLWRPVSYQVQTTCPDALGSVTVSGAVADEGYYPAGSALTVSAVDGNGAFVRWYGAVDANEVSNRTISVAADGVKELRPYFRKAWTYDDSVTPNRVDDGYWTLKVTGSGNLTAFHFDGDFDELDLAKGFTSEGLSFVALGAQAFNGAKGPMMQTLVLPSTLTTIGEKAFNAGHSALKCVLPKMFPDTVTTIGDSAFLDAGLTGDLKLLGASSIAGENAFDGCGRLKSVEVGQTMTTLPGYTFNRCYGITNIVLRRGVKTIGERCFRYCSNLSRIELPSTLTTIGAYAFLDTTKLKTMIFKSKPSVGVNVLYGWSALQARVFIPNGIQAWNEAIADNTQVTLWADCSQNVKDSYLAAYPGEPVPIGVIQNYFNYTQWLCSLSSRGTVIVVK